MTPKSDSRSQSHNTDDQRERWELRKEVDPKPPIPFDPDRFLLNPKWWMAEIERRKKEEGDGNR